MSGFYPVFLKLAGRQCLVVGGGQVAERKVAGLLDCGAVVRVVSPVITPLLSEMAGAGRISWRQGEFSLSDLEGVFLSIVATDSTAVNRAIAEECSRRGILVNVVDDPEHADFFVPAVVRRGSLQIAISTGGKSPYLARKIREDLENIYSPVFEPFLDYLGKIRQRLLIGEPDPERRNEILTQLVDDETLNLLKQGQLEQAKERVKRCLS